jgi:enamine deaminase RidA (YjgF/YER057c/UK114 family)
LCQALQGEFVSTNEFAFCLRTLLASRYDYATGTISPDIVDQTEQIFVNIQKALKDSGSTIEDIVRVRYILPDGKQFPLCWPVLKKWLGDVRPAATMMQAGLMEEIMKIEIEVTAKMKDKSE